MNIASIVYIPPPDFGCAQVFAKNVLKHPATHPLIVLSDHLPWADHFENFVKVAPPKMVKGIERNPNSGISNALFGFSMRVAAGQFKDVKGNVVGPFSHVIYLESDCRVGKAGWDEVVFNEFFASHFPLVAAGSLATFNVYNGGLPYIRPLQAMLAATARHPVPITIYGMFPHGENPNNPCLYPNGAGGVYSVDWMKRLLPVENIQDMIGGKAWDYRLGQAARDVFGPDIFKVFGHLKCVNSTYGPYVQSEADRIEELKAGRCVIAHQVKSNLTI